MGGAGRRWCREARRSERGDELVVVAAVAGDSRYGERRQGLAVTLVAPVKKASGSTACEVGGSAGCTVLPLAKWAVVPVTR